MTFKFFIIVLLSCIGALAGLYIDLWLFKAVGIFAIAGFLLPSIYLIVDMHTKITEWEKKHD